MKELFELIESHQSAALIIAFIIYCIIGFIKGIIIEAIKTKPRKYITYIHRSYDLEWTPITEIPDKPCYVLFRNDNQQGLCRFYTGRWDDDFGFWSRSGFTDHTHYQIIKL